MCTAVNILPGCPTVNSRDLNCVLGRKGRKASAKGAEIVV